MMAPESERAKVCECIPLLARCPVHGDKRPNPKEPTLTCSEVVERLAECAGTKQHFGGFPWVVFDRERAAAILHSWRERRVQELEGLIAKHSRCSHCADSASDDIEREDGDGNSE